MSENNGTEKRGRGRPAGSANTTKSETEKGWREVLKNVNDFAQSMYRDAFAKVVRAEDAAKVSDADVLTAKAAVINALDERERKANAELAAIAKEREDIDSLAIAKAQGSAKGKAEFATTGRAELGNIATALRLSAEQCAAIEGQYLHSRKESAQ